MTKSPDNFWLSSHLEPIFLELNLSNLKMDPISKHRRFLQHRKAPVSQHIRFSHTPIRFRQRNLSSGESGQNMTHSTWLQLSPVQEEWQENILPRQLSFSLSRKIFCLLFIHSISRFSSTLLPATAAFAGPSEKNGNEKEKRFDERKKKKKRVRDKTSVLTPREENIDWLEFDWQVRNKEFNDQRIRKISWNCIIKKRGSREKLRNLWPGSPNKSTFHFLVIRGYRCDLGRN